LPSPPTYHLVNPADTPVLILALTSDTLPLHAVSTITPSRDRAELSQIFGVGAVAVQGGQPRAVRLQVNPARLAGLGMSLDERPPRLAATTLHPKGRSMGRDRRFMLMHNDSCSRPKLSGRR